jgi:hypothetical protein
LLEFFVLSIDIRNVKHLQVGIHRPSNHPVLELGIKERKKMGKEREKKGKKILFFNP